MKTVLLFLLLSPTILWAQLIKVSPQDTQRKQSYLLMRDGSVLRGKVVRQDSSIISVRKRNGDMSFVEADQVVRISPDRPDVPTSMAESGIMTPATVFVLRDGSQVGGTFVRRDSTMITVRKRNGQLTYFEPELLVRVDTVQTQEETAPMAGSAGSTFSNRFSPFLFLNPTAFNLEKGRFYYRNTQLLLNEFHYGITRNWSVGVSLVAIVPYLSLVGFYTFNDLLRYNARLSSKLSVPIGDHFRLGLNADYTNNPVSGSYKRGPLTFRAIASVGTSQRNVTFGYGLISRGTQRIYQYSPVSSSSAPMYVDMSIPDQSFFTLGIMQKVSPLLTLVSDNRINTGQHRFYVNDTGERASLSFAFRFDRQHHAFDLGLYSLVYSDAYKWNDHLVRLLPYLSYNLIIGHP